VTEAFEKLLKEKVQPISPHEEWNGFRVNVLYTVPVNDVFAANLTPLKKIYHMYDNAGSKHMSMGDCIDLFS